MIQAHIIFSGTVQGVGFRFTVQRYAVSLNLVGWVKNLPNGSVEMIVEGSKNSIVKLCQIIEDYFEGHIQNKEVAYNAELNKYKKFEITY